MSISSSKREAAMCLLNLPEEVQDEIFLKVPAESILSSRCVCKVFNNLLSKPSFIKNHLHRTIQIKNYKPKLLFNYKSREQPPVIYSMGIDYASLSSTPPPEALYLLRECDGAVLINYPFESKKIYYLEFLGSCHGLVCSRLCSTNRADYEAGRWVETDYFSVLNPLTKEFKEFTRPRIGYRESVNRGYEVIYGFGYDSSLDDYKLVVISDYECAGCLKIDVYRVKSDSWSSVPGSVNYSFRSGGKETSHGVFFDGALHWLGTATTQENPSEVIVSFDIRNETIVTMQLPKPFMPPVDFEGQTYANLGVWGDCICVAFIWRLVRLDVWVMQKYGLTESWRQKISSFEELWTNCPFWKPIWCYDNDEILIDDDREGLILYHPRTERVTLVTVQNISMNDNCLSYMGSLISLNSGTYLEKRITDGM